MKNAFSLGSPVSFKGVQVIGAQAESALFAQVLVPLLTPETNSAAPKRVEMGILQQAYMYL